MMIDNSINDFNPEFYFLIKLNAPLNAASPANFILSNVRNPNKVILGGVQIKMKI